MMSAPPPPPTPPSPSRQTPFVNGSSPSPIPSDFRSLLAEKKGRLLAQETVVTDKTGRRYKLMRDGGGREVLEALLDVEISADGFMVEGKDDPIPCRVLDYLFVGSQDAAVLDEGVSLCKDAGITHVLNVMDGTALHPETFTYCQVPLLDIPEFSFDASIPKCIDFIKSSKSAGGKVLVHIMIRSG
eukprot:TRINITY_DN4970_c1_g1_i2.p1 TRINITY_DN4970_c1_g1~~TRINITY_DN4970_c1_g1_i2.p1  ORF type:complete len:186 (+),score=23.66 TRINITY_DN4970_c1_g1_i2:232-789(+)